MAVAANAQQQMMVPILEVAFQHGQWWALPQEISASLYQFYASGQNAILRTSITRYKIDFAAWTQTNMDNQRKRSIRLVLVRPQDVVANFTGELPAQ